MVQNEEIVIMHPRLSVVVPTFNEERTLGRVVERLMDVPGLLEIVIVDDGSTDSSLEVAKEPGRETRQDRCDISS
jgi:glycosyltransferase involved in cell wall biosynthesis